MDKEKFSSLMKDESFLKRIVKMDNQANVKYAFKDEGVDISEEEVRLLGDLINKSIEKGGNP